MTDPEMLPWLREVITADKAYWERWLTQGVIVRRDHGEEHVARCEAELSILDKCDKAVRVARSYKDGDGVMALAEAKTWLDATALLAAGYRFHPGWKAEWAA